MKRILPILFCLYTTAIPATEAVNIVTVGAKGDGKTDNTQIIQRAIDEASARQEQVFIPAGTFVTGPLLLKSNTSLYLDKGAILQGITDIEIYQKVFTAWGMSGIPAFLFALNADNIAISGEGVIDGQGQHQVFQHGNDADGGPLRPRLLYIKSSRNIKISSITFQNPAYWTQFYQDCDGVVIRDIKVHAHSNWNNDGIDIDSRNVQISGCEIDCDDDAICFKSESEEICRDIIVQNCTLRSNCNAIKFGTASQGGFQNIKVSDCRILPASEDNIRKWYKHYPWIGVNEKSGLAGIAIESVDGGIIDNLSISQIKMDGIQTPIFIRLGDRKRNKQGKISILRNISIDHIKANATGRLSCSITGIPEQPIEEIHISHISFNLQGGASQADYSVQVKEARDAYPENRMFDSILPAHGFYIRHAQHVYFDKISIKTRNKDIRPCFWLEDVKDAVFYSCLSNGQKAIIKGCSDSSFSTGSN